jgi:hypothetical protein
MLHREERRNCEGVEVEVAATRLITGTSAYTSTQVLINTPFSTFLFHFLFSAIVNCPL